MILRRYDEAEALSDIEEDWVKDTKGEARLSRTAFIDSLFELADMWTAGICAFEYATPSWPHLSCLLT